MRVETRDPMTRVDKGNTIDLASASLLDQTNVDELSVAAAAANAQAVNYIPRHRDEQVKDTNHLAQHIQGDGRVDPQSALLDALEKTILPFMPPHANPSRVTSITSMGTGSDISRHASLNDSAIGMSRDPSLSSSFSCSPTNCTLLDVGFVAEPDSQEDADKPPPLPPRRIAPFSNASGFDILTPLSKPVLAGTETSSLPRPLRNSSLRAFPVSNTKHDPRRTLRRKGLPPPWKGSSDMSGATSAKERNLLETASIEDAEIHGLWISLISAEQKFIDRITKFRQIFYDPVIREWPILEKHAEAIIIEEQIAQLHRQHLLSPMVKQASISDLATCDPAIFDVWSKETHKLYLRYAQAVSHAESSIRTTRSLEPSFSSFVDNLGLNITYFGKSWEEYLLLPMTHLNTYIGKLESLLEWAKVITSSSAEQYEDSVEQALEIVERLHDSCSRYIAESTKREDVQTLYRRIESVMTNQLRHLALSESGRHIIHQGPMALKVNGIGSWKTIHLVLLDNYLIWGRIKPPKSWKHQGRQLDSIWVLEAPIPINKLDISLPTPKTDAPKYSAFLDNIPRNTALFQLFVKDKYSAFKSHTLGVFSAEERQAWYDQMRAVADVATCTRAELPT